MFNDIHELECDLSPAGDCEKEEGDEDNIMEPTPKHCRLASQIGLLRLQGSSV